MSYINKDGSHYSGNLFTNNIIPNKGLPEPLNNIQAANSYIPCGLKGGKNKKISTKYKMNYSKKLRKHRKSRKYKKNQKNQKGGNCGCGGNSLMNGGKSISNKTALKRARKGITARARAIFLARTRGRSRTLRRRYGRVYGGGSPNYPNGYNQYQNNMPYTPNYSLGGKIEPNSSALANPPPLNINTNCTNCVDNYNRFTNSGFASRGWW